MISFVNTNDGQDIRMSLQDCEDITWYELVDYFQRFLVASGYIFANGFDMQQELQSIHDKMIDKQIEEEQRSNYDDVNYLA